MKVELSACSCRAKGECGKSVHPPVAHKSLVELIVLNVGLSAGIINERLFSMFVVVTLVLTFITTPFTVWIYPARVRASYAGPKAKVKHHESGVTTPRSDMGAGGRERTSRLLVVLQKIEHLSAVMFLTQMMEPPVSRTVSNPSSNGKSSSSIEDAGDLSIKSVPSHVAAPITELSLDHSRSGSPVHIDALKLIELTDRTYSVMQSAEKDQLLLTDDVLQLYRQFGRLRGLEITPHISIVETDSFPSAVADHAGGLNAQLVIVPWTIPVVGSSTALIDPSSSAAEKEGLATSSSSALSPFDNIFGSDSTGLPMYSHFIRRVFSQSPADLALFVDRGFGSSASVTPGAGQHIFLPFLGGPDDRLALRLVVQLCQHANVTATVVRITKMDEDNSSEAESSHKPEYSENMRAHQAALSSNQLTVGPGNSGYPGTAHRLASETADDVAWEYYTTSSTSPSRHPGIEAALSRIMFFTQKSNTPLAHAYATAESASSGRGKQWRSLLIVTGRGRRGAAFSHSEEITKWLSERSLNPSIGAELRKTVGDIATGLILGGGQPSSASFLVLEAKA